MKRELYAAAGYLALVSLGIYAVLDRQSPGGGSTAWVELVLLVLVQIAFGFLIGRWWAVLLPLAAVPIAVPAGYPEITPLSEDPFPIWFSMTFVAAFAVPLRFAGVVARKVADRRARRLSE